MPLVPLAQWKTPRKAAAARNHQVQAILAPSKGLNYRDPFVMLDPQEAVVLNNFIAKPTGVELRGGYKKHCEGMESAVNTVMAYNAQDPTQSKLFAAVLDKFYDVTDISSSPPVAVIDTNSSDGYWSNIHFNAPTRNFLCATSPSGGYWTYDSVAGWTDRTAAVTGMTAPFGCVTAWKNRLWFVGEGTGKVFYLPVNSIQGAATEFDLSPLLKHGGSVVAAVNWTMNAGYDIDDYLVFFGSQGDVVVFQGIDPSSASTFALKGVWYMGRPPKGNRFFTSYGGEIFVLTELGVVPLTKMVNGQVANAYSVMSSKIQPMLSPLFSRTVNTPLWEVSLLENQDLLLIKPPKELSTYTQYVMYIQTGAWSTFTDMPINSSCTFNGQMYFGDENGNVHIGLEAKRDGVAADGTGGFDVVGQAQGGFNAYGAAANLKLFSMARPMLLGSTPPSVQVQMNVEYNFSQATGTPNYVENITGNWDEGKWDEAQWAGSMNTYASWAGLQNMGYYGSLRVAVRGDPGTVYVSSNVMYQIGGVM